MATYNINKITLPSGDICKLNASITSTDDNAGNVVLEGVDASSSTPITGISMNGTLLGTSGVINIPAASESSDGVVTTGNQTFAGIKTFVGNPRFAGGEHGGSITFAPNSAPENIAGSIQLWMTQTNEVYRPDRFYFVQRTYNSSTGEILTTNSEQYRLPAVSPDKTETSYYNILTSKSPVTIEQGGTGAITAADAKENLGLGTAAMNFRVQDLSSTASQQWMLKNNVVNSSNSHYGNSTAICVTNNGIFLGEWTSSGDWLGSIWSIQPNDYVTLSGSQTITGNKIFESSLKISGEDSNNQVYINYIFDKHSDYLAGRIAFKETTGGAQASIREACTNTDGNYVSNPVIETYNFPAPTQGRTTGVTYTVITTKNISDIPDASATVAGKVSTGNQTFAGVKTFYSVHTNYLEVELDSAHFVDIAVDTSSSGMQLYFDVVDESIGADRYYLPTLTNTSGNYNILTTKNTKTLTASLTVAGWTTSHTQTVTVTGMTASANIIVSAAPASEVNYRHSGVYCSAQASNSLTFTCTTNPTSALTVQILMIG